MDRHQFRFFHPLRVRYAEVDQQGIVFNAHYLTYFDTALTEYLRFIGFDHREMVSQHGLDFHLVKATVEYRAPIEHDAELDIGVAASRVGNSSITWQLGIYPRGGSELLSLGDIIWVCSKVGAHKSHPLPPALVEKVQAAGGLLASK